MQGYEKNDNGANQFLTQPQYQQMMQQFPETYQKFVKIAQQRAAQATPAPQPQNQVPNGGQPVTLPNLGQK